METTLEPSTDHIDSRLGLGGVLDDIKKDPIGRTIWPASLCPPSLTGGDDPSPSGSYALLDVTAYIANRRNATTAKSVTSGRHEIQATLCVAHPPRVSHLCVCCPALTPSDFGTEPRILATTDGLILFRAAICKSYFCDEQVLQDFFVYHPAPPLTEEGTASSLTRIPHPGSDCHLGISSFGLLRCQDLSATGYFLLHPHHGLPQPQWVVAVLCTCSCKLGETHHFHLHRLQSGDSRWTTTVLPFTPTEPSRGLTFFSHITHKVITLGGGFMGWVDLCRGILLCNMQVDEPELYFVPLPQLLHLDGELPKNARDVRDVAVVNGTHIKYVEHQPNIQALPNGSFIFRNWKVTTCSWKINLDSWEGDWQEEYECDGSIISGSSLANLLSYDEGPTPLPRLPRLHTSLPTLSLDDDDVVYFFAKIDHRDRDDKAVLAVNMRNGMLQEANYLNAKRMVRVSFTCYPQSRMLDCLKTTQGA